MKKAFAISILTYFIVALTIMLAALFAQGEIWPPILLSLLLLIPLYYWKKSYGERVELSKEVNGKSMGTVFFLVFALFFLALLVRVPSVLLFNMPYEKLPLIYLLTLTIILVERTDVSAFGFKTQNLEKAISYGIAFYAILGGVVLFIYYLLIYVFTNQMPIASYSSSSFFLSMPFQTLLVGISEEGLFRGYIQTHLQKFSFYKAIFAQAILFGVWHFVWNLYPFNPFAMAQYIGTTFFIGLMFGYFYSKAKNLVPLILTHGIWNSVPAGIAENSEALALFEQNPFFSQILAWPLAYAMAALAAYLFIKFFVKEI
ncbi:MAG: CPBP family intramembrane glutamic endopeptidase [Candidatus Bathyarchaeia archaeon]